MRAIPNYNTMGLAKASLEASVRYLAEAAGRPEGHRASTASAPARSRRWRPAASRISASCSAWWPKHSPLRRNVTIEDVGNVAAFLLQRPGRRRDGGDHLRGRRLQPDRGGGSRQTRLLAVLRTRVTAPAPLPRLALQDRRCALADAIGVVAHLAVRACLLHQAVDVGLEARALRR